MRGEGEGEGEGGGEERRRWWWFAGGTGEAGEFLTTGLSRVGRRWASESMPPGTGGVS